MACERAHGLQLAKSDRSFGLLPALIAISVVLYVQGKNLVETECPNPFVNGVNKVRCVINITGVAGAGCETNSPNEVRIERNKNGAVQFDCGTHPSYPPTTCSDTGAKCECTKNVSGSASNTYTYTLRLNVSSSLNNNDTMRCTLVPCSPGNITTGPGCTIKFSDSTKEEEEPIYSAEGGVPLFVVAGGLVLVCVACGILCCRSGKKPAAPGAEKAPVAAGPADPTASPGVETPAQPAPIEGDAESGASDAESSVAEESSVAPDGESTVG